MKEKEIAKSFLEGVVTDNVRDVYEKYTHPHFIHHNAYFKSDRDSLLSGMIEDNKRHADKKLTIKHTVEEAPFVTVFAHVLVNDGFEVAVVHLYRFENGKIAELWDISQEIPQDIINEKGMF